MVEPVEPVMEQLVEVVVEGSSRPPCWTTITSTMASTALTTQPPTGHGPRCRLTPATRSAARRQPKSMLENSLSFSRRWRALTWRTVPDWERMTNDWVVAPRLS